MIEEIWSAVSATKAQRHAATLRGYARFRVAGADYPGIVATGDLNDRVEGFVYRDLDATIFVRLDHYEDSFYQRVTVNAIGARNEAVPCETYLVPAHQRKVLSDDSWDLDWFRENAQTTYFQRLGISSS